MKKDIIILAAALFLAGAALVRSETEAPKSTLQVLQDMKAANAALIDQQKKTLDGLDDMQKTADQLKTFSKRS